MFLVEEKCIIKWHFSGTVLGENSFWKAYGRQLSQARFYDWLARLSCQMGLEVESRSGRSQRPEQMKMFKICSIPSCFIVVEESTNLRKWLEFPGVHTKESELMVWRWGKARQVLFHDCFPWPESQAVFDEKWYDNHSLPLTRLILPPATSSYSPNEENIKFSECRKG